MAVSPTDGDVYVVEENGTSADADLLVIDPNNNNEITTIDLGYPNSLGPGDVAVSPTGYVYVTNTESGWVSVISPANQVVDHIDLNNVNGADALDDIAVSPAGPHAGDIYVTTDGAVGTSGGAVFVLGPYGPSGDALLQTIDTQ